MENPPSSYSKDFAERLEAERFKDGILRDPVNSGVNLTDPSFVPVIHRQLSESQKYAGNKLSLEHVQSLPDVTPYSDDKNPYHSPEAPRMFDSVRIRVRKIGSGVVAISNGQSPFKRKHGHGGHH